MYAIIKTGGKQYRVAEGDVIDVELLNTDQGSEVKFGEVLFAFDGSESKVGSPSIANFFVYGEVLGTVKGEKVTTVKYKRSHNQARKWGHRQHYTRVKITGIGAQRKGKEGRHGA
jgi:large subunit ribosomal protein L21